MLSGGTGGEEESVFRNVARSAVAELQRPQAVDPERRPRGGVELAALLRLALALRAREVEGVDRAVAEVADEQVAAERPEACRGQRETPRRVQAPARGDPPEQRARGVVRIDEAMASAGHVIVRGGVLQRVRHIDRPPDALDAKWRVPGGKARVSERAGDVDGDESAVEHVHATV